MLKNCVLPLQYDTLLPKICGEIICQSETSFAMICKFCSIKIFEFSEFVQHFRKAHWAEIFFGDILSQFDAVKKTTSLSGYRCIEAVKYELEQDLLEYNLTDAAGDFDDKDEWTPEKDEQSENSDENNTSDFETLAKINSGAKIKETFKCSLCKHIFTNKSYYGKHVQKHKNDQYKCNKCSKTFSKESKLAQHLNTHNGYSCKICMKVFKSYESLRYHNETHIQTKNFVCDYKSCSKAFVNKRRLNVHKRIHLLESFVCDVCGSRQRNKYALTNHMRNHTGEKPFACNICDRRFTTNSLMNEHKACHETERKHVCDVCGKSFNRQKALYHHKPLHLGIKKFVCKVCGAAYAQAAGLSAHFRKHKEDKITTGDYNSTVNDIFNALFPKKSKS